ncbi:chloride channel protein [Amycolatopsis rhabdoformis]|uniref:Chloride channel protein n=1 Tax=Amycolatopsis rhabdoformis TaxID=1448059 RepID=A0ABZ1IDR0_9PSEU|nr:chloride channel protein [Amycolatopsis rhabdoformis]WSE31886.1 chloride channel protein [Amycolatopsis rhabdoformis]
MRSLLPGAALAGAVAGVAAVAFGQTIAALRSLLSGGPVAVVVLAPVAGVLLCAAVLRAVPDAGGGGIPQTGQAFAGSFVRGRVAPAKGVAAAAVLGSGGSGGAEGPVVHISASLGTSVARLVSLPAASVRPLAAAAVAGGVAGSFGAPLAGVVLVAEVLVEGLAGAELVAVVLGSLTGELTGLVLPGSPLRLPEVPTGGWPLGAVVAGLFGVALAWALYFGGVWAERARDFVERRVRAGVRPDPVSGAVVVSSRMTTVVRWVSSGWVRAVVGATAVGLLVLSVPDVAGVGHPGAATGGVVVLLVLAAVKVVATGVTVGAGGVVGTIGPALFVGATVGSALPGAGGAAAGMAACLAAASRAPVTAVVLAVELSGVDLLPQILVAAALGRLAGGLTRHGIFAVPAPTKLVA